MSFVVVLIVGALVFYYVRSTRQARQNWLQKLDLPGRWQGQADAEGVHTTELTLHGRLDHGEFVRRSGEHTWKGSWKLEGHTLTLSGSGKQEAFDLHYFKVGNIGLEEASGARLILNKSTDNVVPLRSHQDNDSQA